MVKKENNCSLAAKTINMDGLCCVHIITPIIISRNSENIWSVAELRDIPLFTPSITDWNIHILCKLVNQNFQEEITTKSDGVCGIQDSFRARSRFQGVTTRATEATPARVLGVSGSYSMRHAICAMLFSTLSLLFDHLLACPGKFPESGEGCDL
jgi:hypothetical protein